LGSFHRRRSTNVRQVGSRHSSDAREVAADEEPTGAVTNDGV
jgi:hypothetical protein